MPDQSTTDLAVLLAQEIAKQLPVKDIYSDGLSSSTREAGGMLTDLIKTIRLALAPIQYLAVQQDRFRAFIDKAANRVPEAQRISPAPQILGPLLEAIRYEPEGSISDDAFSQLLSRAFDRERLSQAHPAFPSIIRSMSEDEIILLKILKQGKIEMEVGFAHANQDFTDVDPFKFKDVFPQFAFPEQTLVYANHLEALGLVNDLHGRAVGDPNSEGLTSVSWNVELSTFGKLFANSVLGDQSSGA